MHRLSSSFVLGFHGCSEKTAEQLIAGVPFEPSQNDYDWLGGGIYFWLSDPKRAYAFVTEKFAREKRSEKAAVVGAIIDLGLCLDLSTAAGVSLVAEAYRDFATTVEKAKRQLPQNAGGSDLLKRHLDRAVIDYLHLVREQTQVPQIDTVKGVFLEGEPAYPNAGIMTKTHIQIAVRNPDCIKGVFKPR